MHIERLLCFGYTLVCVMIALLNALKQQPKVSDPFATSGYLYTLKPKKKTIDITYNGVLVKEKIFIVPSYISSICENVTNTAGPYKVSFNSTDNIQVSFKISNCDLVTDRPKKPKDKNVDRFAILHLDSDSGLKMLEISSYDATKRTYIIGFGAKNYFDNPSTTRRHKEIFARDDGPISDGSYWFVSKDNSANWGFLGSAIIQIPIHSELFDSNVTPVLIGICIDTMGTQIQVVMLDKYQNIFDQFS